MFKIEMMSMMLDGDDDEVTHGDDVDHKENTTYIEWIVINTQTQLSCLYHILRYQIFKGAKKTFISLIFVAVRFTLISDEKHIPWAH